MHAIGKYQAAVEDCGIALLDAYLRGLDKLGQAYEVIDKADLPGHIGTHFYRKALFTPGTVLIQPSALVKGLADTLPPNVTLHEETCITEVEYGIDFLLSSPGPNRNPPEPFLSAGMNLNLLWGQHRAGLES